MKVSSDDGDSSEDYDLEKKMNDSRTFQMTKFDWRWLVVTYCFLILFHLLPSLLDMYLWQLLLAREIWRFALWTGGGIVLVSAYVGYRSDNITILEPAIASLLYMTTLIVTMSKIRDIHASGYRLIGLLVALHLIALLVGGVGSAVGEWLQLRKERARGIRKDR